MIAEIITIGDELLSGNTIDKNSAYIAQKLFERGCTVNRITTVGDDVESIRKVILESLARGPDVLIISGGLGPTHDDVTMYAVSLATGRSLKLSEEALKWVKEKYEELYRKGYVDTPEINESRKKMAYIPEGAILIKNDVGIAPGALINHGNTRIFVLPGMPSEMRAMLEKYVLPKINATPLYQKKFKLLSKDESMVSKNLREVADNLNVKIHSSPRGFAKDAYILIIMFSESLSNIERAKIELENRGLKLEPVD